MTDDQIKYMVDRFLSWKLPENFNPDGGITFRKFYNESTPFQGEHKPSGTNLLDATQADAMVRHMVEGSPVEEMTISDEMVERAARALCRYTWETHLKGRNLEAYVDIHWPNHAVGARRALALTVAAQPASEEPFPENHST